jgi:predicted nucleotidyltransferase
MKIIEKNFNLTDSGLDSDEILKMRKVFSKYLNIQKVILYGSRAMGKWKPYSDIDLTVLGNEVSLEDIHEIECELDYLLLPYKIDLSIVDQIGNQDLVEHINRVGIVFYDRNGE